MNRFILCLFAIILSIPFISSNAEIQNISTNKSLYHFGDSLIISGNVSYDSSIPSIILQIITPSGNGLAHIDSITPKNSGSFSKTINVGGPTWSENGQYTIKLTYGGNSEKIIQYENSSSESQSKSTTSDDTSSIPTFPSVTIPNEQSSIDQDELENKNSYVINPKMKLFGFPSFNKSPQYYIDRYNTEPQYRSWFDSQFQGRTIYDILGFSTYIPSWIKSYAQNWVTGQISDVEFMIGLDFMLDNNIIIIPGLDYEKTSVDEIPSWFRNIAHWWSSELISQQEFINSIKYLIQEEIILIE